MIGRLQLESWVEPWVYRGEGRRGEGSRKSASRWADRLGAGREAVRDIVGEGLALRRRRHRRRRGHPRLRAAGLHGLVHGAGAWWSVPLAVLIGIPLYSNAAGIIPIVQALLGKGAALGTVLAFMMSVIALSLPEMVILRKVLTVRLIAVFVGVVGAGILVVGYLFNLVL